MFVMCVCPHLLAPLAVQRCSIHRPVRPCVCGITNTRIGFHPRRDEASPPCGAGCHRGSIPRDAPCGRTIYRINFLSDKVRKLGNKKGPSTYKSRNPRNPSDDAVADTICGSRAAKAALPGVPPAPPPGCNSIWPPAMRVVTATRRTSPSAISATLLSPHHHPTSQGAMDHRFSISVPSWQQHPQRAPRHHPHAYRRC